jgi:hypothetical protein
MSTARFVAALIAASGAASGSIAVTDSADVVAVSGTATTAGSIAVTDAADTVSIVGSSPGTIAVTDGPDAVSLTGTATTQGAVAVTDAADAVALSGSVGASNNIRLQPGLYLERGGYAASLTSLRWWVLNAAMTQVENSGTGATTNSSGQLTIDITASASYVVGDYVPLIVASYNAATSAPDRTVLSGLMFAQAIAQP